MLPAEEAIEALVHDYYKLVFHTIYGLTNNWEESQDLTQDTFHQALKGIDAARAASGATFSAKAWLLRIALNTVRMQQRRRSLFRFIPFSSLAMRTQQGDENKESVEESITAQAAPLQPGGYGADATPDLVEHISEQDAVQRTMTKLPEAFRTCLLLHIVAGLTPAEIARLLDLKEAAVRQRLSRARKQFEQIYTYESGETIETRAEKSEEQAHSDSEQRQGIAEKQASERSLHLTVYPPTTWSSYG